MPASTLTPPAHRKQVLPVLLALLTGAAMLAGSPATEADTITLRADDWCPYNCDPASEQPGYAVEIARKVFEAAGHTVDYQLMPWARTLVEVRNGNVDGAIGAAPDEAEGLVFPERSIGSSDNQFWVKRGNSWRYTGPASLEQIRLGAILNYTYSEDVDAVLAANRGKVGKVTLATGDDALEKNLKMLDLGRLDAVIENTAVARYRLKELGLSEAMETAGGFEPTPVYIAFTPAKPQGADYAKLLSEGIAKLRASGELAQIMARYGLKDWE